MKVFNFSAGPSALAEWVKVQAYEEFMSYQGKGFNIAEISHRSSWYEEINKAAHEDLLDLYGLDKSEYSVCLVQGGATMQFSLMGMNFAPNKKINMIDTDVWTQKAASEQRACGMDVNILASSKESGFDHIPEVLFPDSGADFCYICSNNTVAGTQYAAMPNNLGDLIVDASSDFISKKVDFSNIAVMFAGAQKNAGIAGVVPVIIRKDFLSRSEAATLPAQMKYFTHANAKSLFNTPPTWPIYIFSLVLKWLKNQGGLEAIEQQNIAQARAVYEYLDSSEFYKALVHKDRSLMNVCFATPNAELDTLFHTQAAECGLIGLKGHKLKGGLRASIYNSCTNEQIDALLNYCDEFKRKHS